MFDITHLWPRPHCDLSQFPTDVHNFTPEQREMMVQLLSEQPVWWLEEKRASIPHLGEKSVQRMADKLVADAIARATRGNPTKPPKIGSKFTVPRPRKPFQITVTNVTAKSVIGKDSRGKKWRVPLGYLAPKSKKPAKQRGKTAGGFTYKTEYGTTQRVRVKKMSGGYQGFQMGEDDGGPIEYEVTGVEKSVAAVKAAVMKHEAAFKKENKRIQTKLAKMTPEEWRNAPFTKEWGKL